MEPEIREILPGFLFEELRAIKKPSRIFWGSTFELFHDSIPDLWRKDIFAMVGQFPQHTHIFLTKRPQNLLRWSPFSGNCWVGVSVTDREAAHITNFYLPKVEARVKFISFEPLLDDVMRYLYMRNLIEACNWLIIGAQTHPNRQPAEKWVAEIIDVADEARIPIFVKNNLKALPSNAFKDGKMRQEFPNV